MDSQITSSEADSELNLADRAANTETTAPVTPPAIEPSHLYECSSCGYVYEPASGDQKRGISGGTPFEQLPDDWRCPVCTARKNKFSDIGLPNKPSGFSENLGYGFGVNVMTPGQKNLLIFGALALAFIFFMSLYALD
ncbi:rubredoxin [Tumidithrix helvetica PCC 7403]|uniref:rubredoxin n=1 Tax=Tumidithrix helvetica TaxID=3457545 RepID=UPI003CB78629